MLEHVACAIFVVDIQDEDSLGEVAEYLISIARI